MSNRQLLIIWIAFQVSTIHLLFGFSSAAKKLPAAFIFGDSAVDAGNNYYISTAARSSFPNGIDFPVQPSGRFSNGRTISDCIEERFGLKFAPPYLAPNTTLDLILKGGVNFASTGSGILDDTGKIWSGYINMKTQIDYYEKTREDIISRIGLEAATKLLRQSLFMVITGGNDVLLTSGQPDLTAREAYFDNLTSIYKTYLARLYDLDARKIAVSAVGKVGCIPLQRELLFGAPGCVPKTDEVIQSYNRKLKDIVDDLTVNLDGATYVFIDYYAVMEHMINNYRSYGFENADLACCHFEIGSHFGVIPCFAGLAYCPDRSKYFFWDAFHMSDAANVIASKLVVDGNPRYTSPMNLRQLVDL